MRHNWRTGRRGHRDHLKAVGLKVALFNFLKGVEGVEHAHVAVGDAHAREERTFIVVEEVHGLGEHALELGDVLVGVVKQRAAHGEQVLGALEDHVRASLAHGTILRTIQRRLLCKVTDDGPRLAEGNLLVVEVFALK